MPMVVMEATVKAIPMTTMMIVVVALVVVSAKVVTTTMATPTVMVAASVSIMALSWKPPLSRTLNRGF